ncbi:uncharacterized protein EV420DRAFT_1561840 [Desarmillaria tabescens]|uniref:Uncharacterized protein n=1 Tax=Armillaria tabescens TaxID=1929756 RepID=A0AA39MY85_ARMTA|nr:uncharacterized protein EV420DRAFT_1561840 [Desarmillaria tabescens]KAK0450454.1 hypothetical protein EV420DRAFT_1561840 [Desarmillaria tabescens]
MFLRSREQCNNLLRPVYLGSINGLGSVVSPLLPGRMLRRVYDNTVVFLSVYFRYYYVRDSQSNLVPRPCYFRTNFIYRRIHGSIRRVETNQTANCSPASCDGTLLERSSNESGLIYRFVLLVNPASLNWYKGGHVANDFSPVKLRNSYLNQHCIHPHTHTSMCTSSSSSVVVCDHSGHRSSSVRPALTTSGPKGRGASEPQCCHCGWRGAHAPGCPFG